MMYKFLGLFVLLTAVGCGGNGGVTISGKAQLADGTPLKYGSISLTGDGKSYSGQIETNGDYKIENVAKGDYKVTLTGAVSAPGGGPVDFTNDKGEYVRTPVGEYVYLADRKYTDLDKTTAQLKVPGDYTITFDPPKKSSK